jgi:DNA polymerase III delta subunit
MIQIFHGDGTATSRKLLQEAIAKDRANEREIQALAGDKLAPKDLESVLAAGNLFAQESLVIENLLGRLRSKDKDACIQLIAEYQGEKNIFLWDKREITKPNLAKLAKARVSISKAPTALFTLTESLEPGSAGRSLNLLHQTVKDTEDIIVFTMIARQVSYLIMIKSGTSPKFAPWQMGKLKTQATKWSDKQLSDFLSQLLDIDFSIKTGRSKLSYTDHLDLLLTTLLR